LGNGDGNLQAPVFYSTPARAFAFDIADTDGDGALDLVVPNLNGISVFFGNGDGSFQTPITSGPPFIQPLSVAVADFNQDGIPDVVVSDYTKTLMFLGTGNGTFMELGQVTVGVAHIHAADFNGDGKADLMTVNGSNVDIRPGRGDGTFSLRREFLIGGGLQSASIADFDGDGHLDVVFSDALAQTQVALGLGDGGLQVAPFYSAGGNPLSIATGDFNGDGSLDMAVPDDNLVQVLLNRGDGSFASALTACTECREAVFAAAADLNHDGRLDLAVADKFGNRIRVLLGNGDGTFQLSKAFLTLKFPSGVAIGDFNGDGNLDLAASLNAAHAVAVLLGNGDGTFQPAVDFPADPGPTSVATADLNADGKLDLVVANSIDVTILLGNGDGTFQSQDFGHFNFAYYVVISDLNNDGKQDLAVAESGGFAVTLGNGDGTFLPVKHIAVVPAFPTTVAVGDFNNDKKQDIALTLKTPGEGVYVFYGNGNASFQPGVQYMGSQNLTFVAAADVNGDRAVDLLVANSVFNVEVALNTGGTFMQTTSSPNPSHLNQPVTIITTLKAGAGFVPPPIGGSVLFMDGTTNLGTVPVTNGQAILSTSALSVGRHKISALYSGDLNYDPNAAAPIVQIVK
jgi:hypothetical protein